jgi:hypothetical protein
MVINPYGHPIYRLCYDKLNEPKKCPKCRGNAEKTLNVYYGGYKQKYLKYKNKYLKLKNYKS